MNKICSNLNEGRIKYHVTLTKPLAVSEAHVYINCTDIISSMHLPAIIVPPRITRLLG